MLDPGDILYDELGPEFCPWCGHEWRHHDDPYGCEVERGDGVGYSRHGIEVTMALGPCGCEAKREEAA